MRSFNLAPLASLPSRSNGQQMSSRLLVLDSGTTKDDNASKAQVGFQAELATARDLRASPGMALQQRAAACRDPSWHQEQPQNISCSRRDQHLHAARAAQRLGPLTGSIRKELTIM